MGGHCGEPRTFSVGRLVPPALRSLHNACEEGDGMSGDMANTFLGERGAR